LQYSFSFYAFFLLNANLASITQHWFVVTMFFARSWSSPTATGQRKYTFSAEYCTNHHTFSTEYYANHYTFSAEYMQVAL